jgi:hypothetical protein
MVSKVRLAPLTIVRHATPLLLEAALGRSASSRGSSPLPSMPRLGHLILDLRIASSLRGCVWCGLEFGQAISPAFITATSSGVGVRFHGLRPREADNGLVPDAPSARKCTKHSSKIGVGVL